MIKVAIAALFTAVFVFLSGVSQAEARPRSDAAWSEPADAPFWEQNERPRRGVRQARQQRYHADDSDDGARPSRRSGRSYSRTRSVTNTGGYGAGPRPGRWCGWYMRTRHGGGAEYNLARNWRKRGTPVSGPQVGAIVVWNSHVGEITGQAGNGKWIVLSGNDGGQVRERARSVSGASFRVL